MGNVVRAHQEAEGAGNFGKSFPRFPRRHSHLHMNMRRTRCARTIFVTLNFNGSGTPVLRCFVLLLLLARTMIFLPGIRERLSVSAVHLLRKPSRNLCFEIFVSCARETSPRTRSSSSSVVPKKELCLACVCVCEFLTYDPLRPLRYIRR